MTDESHGRDAQGNAGAFLAPETGMIPAPMAPLGGIEDAPPEPDDPTQAPLLRRRRSLLDTLLGRNAPPPKNP